MEIKGPAVMSSDLVVEISELDLLGELGRATTVFHEAPPDQFDLAREAYELALSRFKNQSAARPQP